MGMNLAPVVQADGPQLRFERWTNLLTDAEIEQVVNFVRDTEEIRSDVNTVNSMNTIFARMKQIVEQGDLADGGIKTLPEAKVALIRLIAARNVGTARWLKFTNQSVEQRFLAEKVAAGSGASVTFGQAAGALSGADRSGADLQS